MKDKTCLFVKVLAFLGLLVLNCISLETIGSYRTILGVLLILCLFSYLCASFVEGRKETKQENQRSTYIVESRIPQTPILPEDASNVERQVMRSICRKVLEYDAINQEKRSRFLYRETDELQELEGKMDSLRKEIKRVGCFDDGEYKFCDFLFLYDGENASSLPKFEILRHFSRYFNEKCNRIIKNVYRNGLEKSKEHIAVLADYMLHHLTVNIDKNYVAVKIQEAELSFHISSSKIITIEYQ